MMNIRHHARVAIEATSPMLVSTGERSLETDAPFVTDANGLPQIPGTSLAGAIRHYLEDRYGTDLGDPTGNTSSLDLVFGYQQPGHEDSGLGSRIAISGGQIVGPNGTPIDGIAERTESLLDFVDWFRKAPVRDHVRINSRGAADSTGRGKFDEQIVYRGTRFVFDIEMEGTGDDCELWDAILKTIHDPAFRLGSRSRRGYGSIRVVWCKQRKYDLREPSDRSAYLALSSRLDAPIREHEEYAGETGGRQRLIEYTLRLRPVDLFLFGVGYEDGEANNSSRRERVVLWNDQERPRLSDPHLVIPASSVKGALSHRVACHFNLLTDFYANGKSDGEIEGRVGTANQAVLSLFGAAKGDQNAPEGQRGRVILSDLYVPPESAREQILNHVAIDRFTGGAFPGALFSERTATSTADLVFNVYVEPEAFKAQYVREAWERTLRDVCTAMLPLGGGVMRGHGCFVGTVDGLSTGQQQRSTKEQSR